MYFDCFTLFIEHESGLTRVVIRDQNLSKKFTYMYLS